MKINIVNNNFLFNFSVSYSGGGVKRLQAYAKWFNENGGAHFIIHENCEFLIEKYKFNRYFIVSQNKLTRLFNDCSYLKRICEEVGVPLLYYSYGIPIYKKIGQVNWFHLSNVLPIQYKGIPLSIIDKLKMKILGAKIVNNYNNANIISAESMYSLGLIKNYSGGKLVLSVNGNDDELESLKYGDVYDNAKDNIAVILGTYSYKMLDDSIIIFNFLKNKNKNLKLVIIGNKKNIPEYISKREDVLVTGVLDNSCVLKYLKKSKFYISTTLIENSYNAASEGIFYASESYISDIEPHRELLDGIQCDYISLPKMNRRVIRVTMSNSKLIKLKYWSSIINDMIFEISNLTASRV